jgi:hypothetical protein
VPIGVVSEDGDYNSALGFAAGSAWPVASAINVTDTSHYITAVFPAGPLDIYAGGMEQLTISGTGAPGLQTLADTGGAGSLVVLDKGADMAGGGATAGRRVMLPLGRVGKFNWDYLNGNGRLLVQRALQWGTGNTGVTAPSKNLLFVAAGTSPTAQEQLRIDLIESWGYVVNIIDDADSQANFDTAVAANDVAYVSSTVSDTALNTKLRNANIGVVNENMPLAATFGFGNDYQTKSRDEIRVLSSDHYITNPFALGYLPIFTSVQAVFQRSSSSYEMDKLADSYNVGSDSNNKPSLLTINSGTALEGGGTAAGRRAQLPWGSNTFDVSALNADGQTIMQRAIEWAEGAGAGAAPQKLLLVAGNAGSLTTEELAHKSLVDSWGYMVEVIDESDDQATFDAAVAGNDVVLITNDVTASTVGTKLVNATIGVVTSEVNLSDEFGISASVGWNSGTQIEINDNSHYITQPFATGLMTILPGAESLAYVTGTTSPDLGQLASSTSGFGVVTLEAGAATYTGGIAAGRRVQLPWGGNGFNPDNLNADGKTILQRAIEWGAGASGGGGGPGPIAHWKLDEATGTTAVDSAGGHNGTTANTTWTTGHVDGALEFNSSADSVTVPDAAELSITDELTITAWINKDGLSGYDPAVTKATTGSDLNYLLGTWEDEVVFGFSTATDNWQGYYTSGANLSTGNWYHIAATYDNAGNAVRIYLDGVQIFSTTTTLEPVTNGGPVRLGRSAINEYWPGRLDDVRIYNQVLSDAEIATLASGGGGGGGGGGGCDGTFRDEFSTVSFSNNDGTLNWTGDWLEVGESDGPTANDVRVRDDNGPYQLWLRDNQNGGEGVEREADLSGATAATLSFVYRRSSLDNANDYVKLEISSNGSSGPWVELARFQGSATDSAYLPFSQDISGYISANTRIRLITSPTMGNLDLVIFDNIEISCTP